MPQQLESIAQALSAEFAMVAGSLLGVEAQSSPTTEPLDIGWVVPCRLEAPVAGCLFLGFHKPDAAVLAARLLMAEEASEADIADALAEVVGQTLGAAVAKQSVLGLSGKTDRPEAQGALDGPPVGSFACAIDERFAIRVSCWFEPGPVAAKAQALTPVSVSAPAAVRVSEAPGRPAASDNLDILLDIDMPLSVRFGEAVMTLDALTRMGPGSLIELARQPDDPVDVLINGRLVARGEVVVVSGNYGVRVTEVVSALERINSMNA